MAEYQDYFPGYELIMFQKCLLGSNSLLVYLCKHVFKQKAKYTVGAVFHSKLNKTNILYSEQCGATIVSKNLWAYIYDMFYIFSACIDGQTFPKSFDSCFQFLYGFRLGFVSQELLEFVPN